MTLPVPDADAYRISSKRIRMAKNERLSIPPFNPLLALVSGALAISTGAIFARLADAPALVTAAYRLSLASLILFPFAWYKARREFARLSTRDMSLAMLAGFSLALHFATWISSLDFTSVANSVVLVNTNPLWVGLLTPLITKDRLTRWLKISLVISVAGGVIIGIDDYQSGGNALWGDLLALAGSICAAFYLLLGRNLRLRLSLMVYVILCYASAAIILWILVIVFQKPVTGFSGVTYADLGGMALISQVIGHTSYNWALKWLSAGMVAIGLLGEPIGSSILAYFIFGEGLTPLKIIGGALILGAIYLAARSEKTDRPRIDKKGF